MRVFAFLMPSALAVQVVIPTELSSSHMHMEETLRAIAAQKNKDGKLDNFTADTVRLLLTNITSQLEDALDDDAELAQSQLTNASKWVNDTNDDIRSVIGTGGAIFVAKAGVDTSESTFDQCKSQECGLYPIWCDSKAQLACHICTWDEIPELTKDGDCDFAIPANGDSEELCDCIEGWNNWYTGAAGARSFEPYLSKRTEVYNALQNLEQKQSECKTDQENLDRELCSAQDVIWDECTSYGTLYDIAKQNYDNVKSTVENMESTFKHQQCALEKLVCYGNQILSETTNLDECESEDDCDISKCNRCPDLSIEYHPVESKIDCWNDNKYPGTPGSTWYDTEYYKEWDDLRYENNTSCEAIAHNNLSEWCADDNKCPTYDATECTSTKPWNLP